MSVNNRYWLSGMLLITIYCAALSLAVSGRTIENDSSEELALRIIQKHGTQGEIGLRRLEAMLDKIDMFNFVKTSSSECLSPDEFLSEDSVKTKKIISLDNLRRLCPEVLQQLDDCPLPDIPVASRLLNQNLQVSLLRSGGGGRAKNETYGPRSIPTKVWVAAFISIFIISAVGLAGVAVVPLVQKVFYNHVIQFLVAVAVGTLTGDAMLHLLPHAIVASVEGSEGSDMPEHEHGEHERAAIFKGLAALAGVYFFFMAEKTLALVSDYRAEKKAEEEERQRAIANPRRSEARRPSAVGSSGRRGSAINPNSPMYRKMSRAMSATGEDILTTGLSSRAMRSIDNLIRYAEPDSEDEFAEEAEGSAEPATHLVVPGMKGATPENKSKSDEDGTAVSIKVPVLKKPDHEEDGEHGHAHDGGDGHAPEAAKKHGHGHSHEVPDSIAAVAWMVILGDGLHNFSDGMAIGAAFAQSMSGGLSTGVAVFCHELPHELGDFAVLLKTGMKVKQALFYNMLSSVLCFVGMIIGICLGNIETASYWIFAVAGGMFIYIALVDMLPELSSAEIKPGESRLFHFALQNVGLCTGVSIMLTIALYEENIKDLIDFE